MGTIDDGFDYVPRARLAVGGAVAVFIYYGRKTRAAPTLIRRPSTCWSSSRSPGTMGYKPPPSAAVMRSASSSDFETVAPSGTGCAG